VIAGFGPRGELPSPSPSPSLSSPPPPLLLPCVASLPAPLAPHTPAPSHAPRWLARPGRALPGGSPAPAVPPPRWRVPSRWPCRPGRARAVLATPMRALPGRALAYPCPHPCPCSGGPRAPAVSRPMRRRAQRALARATVVVRCLILSLIHFNFSLVNVLCRTLCRATIHLNSSLLM
jgi:hypothetical protein